MPHDTALIATIAAGFGLAMVLGLLAARLKLPPLVGYLLAGVAVGPATPGFVADIGLAGQLAEIGVMLLMFGVGLHFSFGELMAVRRVAVPGALLQIAVATALGAGLGWAWGWSLGGALVFGLCLSVASTVVLLRALEARGLLHSGGGQIAVGWLVVEDLVMVLVLVLLPVMAGGGATATGDSLGWTVALTLAKVGAFIALMLVLGRRLLPRWLWWVAATGSQELFRLSVVAIALGVAFGAAALFDVSFALGAFFAGMVMRESEFSQRAADESLPLRDAFAVLFFVSVGMLFDPAVLWQQPLQLLLTVAVVLLGKTVAAVALVLALRLPLGTAMTVGAGLAQIGEFSFILAGLGVALGLLPLEGQSLVLAAAMVSIAANSALFPALERLQQRLVRRWPAARRWALREDPLEAVPDSVPAAVLERPLVLLGHGRVGAAVAARLRAEGRPLVVAEQRREVVDELRQAGVAAVCGDARLAEVLVQAHVARAAMLLVALPQEAELPALLALARQLQPGLPALVCAATPEGAHWLRQALSTEPGVTVLDAPQALAEAVARALPQAHPAPGGAMPAGAH